MREQHRLLVVEDEQNLASGLKLNLELEGYAVDVAASGRQALARLVERGEYSAILLDVMLPDIDGFALCSRIREAGNYTPVLMLTAKSSAADRVQGLEVGADDYLVKPFELTELLARVQSLLRRQQWDRKLSGQAAGDVLAFGDAVVNFETQEVKVRGTPVKLTRLELDLLRYFGQNPGRVLSREELLENVWQLGGYTNSRTVDNFILRMRKCFEPDPHEPIHFVSIRGSGYKFIPGGEDGNPGAE
ncbi:MAG: response regulator transcription factor [Planctomycetota bacterium]